MEHNLYICIYVKDILVLAVHMWSGHVIGPSAIMWVLVFRTVFTLSSTNNSSCTRICSPAAVFCKGSLPDQGDHFNTLGVCKYCTLMWILSCIYFPFSCPLVLFLSFLSLRKIDHF